MEEKSLTNIAKILRNAPKNIMLYCPVIGHVRFLGITNAMGFDNGIQVKNIVGTNDPVLDKYGRWTREGKCVLFPTEFAATWDNWQDELFGFGHFITDDRDKKETLVISGHDTALAYDSKGCEVTVYKPAYRWATESEIESFLAEVYKNGLEYNHNTRTFTKQEPKLPQSWEEFCNMHDVSDTEYFIDDVGGICNAIAHKAFISRSQEDDKNLLPDRATAEAVLALCQLIQLRNCYNGGWVPNWGKWNKDWGGEPSCCIVFTKLGDPYLKFGADGMHILAFKSEKLATKFLANFKPLIKKAMVLCTVQEPAIDAEVPYSPKWKAGDTVASSLNPNLVYSIQSIVPADDGRQDYCVELFDEGQSCGTKYIDCRKMDEWGVLEIGCQQ